MKKFVWSWGVVECCCGLGSYRYWGFQVLLIRYTIPRYPVKGLVFVSRGLPAAVVGTAPDVFLSWISQLILFVGLRFQLKFWRVKRGLGFILNTSRVPTEKSTHQQPRSNVVFPSTVLCFQPLGPAHRILWWWYSLDDMMHGSAEVVEGLNVRHDTGQPLSKLLCEATPCGDTCFNRRRSCGANMVGDVHFGIFVAISGNFWSPRSGILVPSRTIHTTAYCFKTWSS